MIIDAHTHVFPPSVRDRRAALIETEPAFAGAYAGPNARGARAGDYQI